MPRLRHVRFVLHDEFKWVGSSLMRSEQLGRFMVHSLGPDFRYSMTEIPSNRYGRMLWAAMQPKDCVLFFTKATLRRVSQKLLDLLAFRGIPTCLDYVDSDLRRCKDLDPAVHVAASVKAEAELRRMTTQNLGHAKVALIHHAPDERLIDFVGVKQDTLRPAYLGLPQNAFWSPSISDSVSMLKVGSVEEMEDCLTRLPEFNLHYCVRGRTTGDDEVVAKPFTKGFVAAYCSSPVIVDRTEFDAEALLGQDYPYMVEEANESNVLEMLEHARVTFQSPVWDDALDRVRDLKSVCSPEAVSRQFVAMVEELE